MVDIPIPMSGNITVYFFSDYSGLIWGQGKSCIGAGQSLPPKIIVLSKEPDEVISRLLGTTARLAHIIHCQGTELLCGILMPSKESSVFQWCDILRKCVHNWTFAVLTPSDLYWI